MGNGKKYVGQAKGYEGRLYILEAKYENADGSMSVALHKKGQIDNPLSQKAAKMSQKATRLMIAPRLAYLERLTAVRNRLRLKLLAKNPDVPRHQELMVGTSCHSPAMAVYSPRLPLEALLFRHYEKHYEKLSGV